MSFKRKKIQDESIAYNFVYKYVRFSFIRFFREFKIGGVDNIPAGKPVIFAPNHQSGLLDPLIVLFGQKKPIVFMARADIFRSGKFNGILYFLRIMPVYRIRDGYENLSKNEGQFEITRDILLDRKQLCIMPEGNHGHQHKLRPLVKGIFRIAFSTEEELKGSDHVFIVPVAIDHNIFRHAGADVVINFGKPIPVSDYMTQYKDNQANAINSIKEELSERLSGMMQDIRSESNYDFIYALTCYLTPVYKEICSKKGLMPLSKSEAEINFEARKKLGLLLDKTEKENPELLEEWILHANKLEKVAEYPFMTTELMEYNFNVVRFLFQTFLGVVLSPGLLMNIPSLLVNRKISSMIEDKQMHNTYAFMAGLILNPLNYLIVAIIIAILLKLTFLKFVILLIATGLIGLAGEKFRQHIRKPFKHFIYNTGKNKTFFRQCKNDYNNLKNAVYQYIDKSVSN
jgi:1-acyl-sn-glycerol-3-phosphate acyltransferase